MQNIWTEKYRPEKLDDLCIDQNTKSIIINYGRDIPNFLFCGVQGTGKTTLARIIVRDILKCDYLYINASDESGIDTIRNKVTGFSKTKSLDGNIKVVILDEADFMSNASQAALRNLTEEYSSTTRFILTGNYKHKIIPAIQSRCQNLLVTPTLKDAVVRCLYILQNEGIYVSNEDKKQIVLLVKKFFPDLRKCINELQKCFVSGSFKSYEKTDSLETIQYIWNNIHDKKTLDIRKYLIETQSSFNSDWDKLLIDLLNYVYSSKLEDSVKKTMILVIADHLEKSVRVIDKEINFFACILNLEEML